MEIWLHKWKTKQHSKVYKTQSNSTASSRRMANVIRMYVHHNLIRFLPIVLLVIEKCKWYFYQVFPKMYNFISFHLVLTFILWMYIVLSVRPLLLSLVSRESCSMALYNVYWQLAVMYTGKLPGNTTTHPSENRDI